MASLIERLFGRAAEEDFREVRLAEEYEGLSGREIIELVRSEHSR